MSTNQKKRAMLAMTARKTNKKKRTKLIPTTRQIQEEYHTNFFQEALNQGFVFNEDCSRQLMTTINSAVKKANGSSQRLANPNIQEGMTSLLTLMIQDAASHKLTTKTVWVDKNMRLMPTMFSISGLSQTIRTKIEAIYKRKQLQEITVQVLTVGSLSRALKFFCPRFPFC